MAASRRTLTWGVHAPTLIAADMIAELNCLPLAVQLEVYPIVARFWTMRLTTADGRASPLLIAFAGFVDRLVDEIEASED